MSEELIVLVDDAGKPIGSAEKLGSHHDKTPLHLAFSCYVFNFENKLLVTRRALSKKVHPGLWSSTACGHPAPEETFENAIKRRVQQELGMKVKDIRVILPDYRYKTPLINGVVENEICPVYIARASSPPKPNTNEVEDFRWMQWSEYIKAVESDKNGEFSWWSKDQLKQLKDSPLLPKECAQ